MKSTKPNYRNESTGNMILVYLQSKTKRKFWLLVKIEMRFFCRYTDSYILESQTVVLEISAEHLQI